MGEKKDRLQNLIILIYSVLECNINLSCEDSSKVLPESILDLQSGPS